MNVILLDHSQLYVFFVVSYYISAASFFCSVRSYTQYYPI